MTVDLDKLEALAKAATPGPWSSQRLNWILRYARKNEGPWDDKELVDDVLDVARHTQPDDDDAPYIAAASPDVVLALIAEVRAARRSFLAAYRAWREANACKVCFAMPDEDGERLHGRACDGRADRVSTEGL